MGLESFYQRILAFFLSLLAFFANVKGSVIQIDNNTPTIIVSNVSASPDSDITVTLFFENNPGVAGMKLTIAYDSEFLTLVSSKSGECLDTLSFTKPGRYTSPCSFTWDSESGMASENGEILKLTFKVSSVVEIGTILDITCTYRQGDIYDENLQDVDFEVINGAIRINRR